MRAVSFIREIREELRLVRQNPLLYQLLVRDSARDR